MKACYYVVVVLLVGILPSSCVLEGGVPGQAGGYVFYDKGRYSDGWRYLECAPEDAGGECGWEVAKSRCDDYAYGGYDDWRLPSDTEIDWMYYNLHKKGMGNFKIDYYFASYSNGRSYLLDFSSGKGKEEVRPSDSCVRPIRRF
jgi:hypothetical protein